jgi:hypothetical protein
MKRFLLTIFLAFFADAVWAQTAADFSLTSADGRKELGFLFGAFQPMAEFGISNAGGQGEKFGSFGFAGAMDYFYALTPAVSAGLEGMYISRGEYALNNLSAINETETLVRGDSVVALALLRVRNPVKKGLRPYGTFGLGLHRTTMDIFIQAPPGFAWVGNGPEYVVARGITSGLAWALRGGVEHVFADGGVLGFELGWLGIPSQRYPLTGDGRAIGLRNDVVSGGDGLTMAAKFAVRFGGGS